jgi:hypothetical protein
MLPLNKTLLRRYEWIAELRRSVADQMVGKWRGFSACGRPLRCAVRVLLDLMGLREDDATSIGLAASAIGVREDTLNAVIFLNDKGWNFNQISDELYQKEFNLKTDEYAHLA